MSEVTEQQLEDMEALFVQTAASMNQPAREPSRCRACRRRRCTSPTVPSARSGTCCLVSSSPTGQQGTTVSRTTPRRPSCRSASRATGLRRMRSWSSRIRTWTEERRADLQHQGPRRHRTGCHRAMCAVHRPIGASVVTGLRNRDAPARASSGALRAGGLGSDSRNRRRWRPRARSDWLARRRWASTPGTRRRRGCDPDDHPAVRPDVLLRRSRRTASACLCQLGGMIFFARSALLPDGAEWVLGRGFSPRGIGRQVKQGHLPWCEPETVTQQPGNGCGGFAEPPGKGCQRNWRRAP